ncbi:unnamed protein product [Arctogadus glacialis]
MEAMALKGEPQQQSPQPYRWTDEDTEALIRWRGANDVFFTGRRNASVFGFQTYIKDMELEGKVEALWAKKKWENLKQKYKELKAPRTGSSTRSNGQPSKQTFVRMRVAHKHLFTGGRDTAGYRTLIEQLELTGRVTPLQAKKSGMTLKQNIRIASALPQVKAQRTAGPQQGHGAGLP